jgi:glyoxylase-like metal-dependent hydrolase (beta-lactamase superfamily II)
MKVTNLSAGSRIYTSNVYLCTGDWNRLEDVNTIIDVGNDPSVIEKIDSFPSGVGKKKVEQVILTHNHSDHSGILPLVKRLYNPEICAFSPYQEGVTRILKDGDMLRAGDRILEVIHMPAHSEDSVCLYSYDEGMLFAGDTPVIVKSSEGRYSELFIQKMGMLCRNNVRIIYFGHGEPLTENPLAALRDSYRLMIST